MGYVFNVCVMVMLSTLPSISHSLERMPEGQNSENIILSGKLAKALLIAAKDFEESLPQRIDNQTSELGAFLLDIKDYLVRIKTDGAAVVVNFQPGRFQESFVKGGGAKYRIDSDRFIILDKEYSM
jgi:hypothetical protein